MMIPTMESIVDLVSKGEKMPPKLLKSFTNGHSSANSVATSELQQKKSIKTTQRSEAKASQIVSANKELNNKKTIENAITNKQAPNDYKLEFDFL